MISQVLLNPLPPLCADMGQREFPRRLVSTLVSGSTRPLHVGLLNLMPTKEVTERQWLRLLLQAEHPGPLQVHLLKLTSWQPSHTNPLHMAQYYTSVEHALATNQLDMLIITGAPLGRLNYAEVGYWPELSALMCELAVRAMPTLFSCWAAQAALHHLYQIPTLRREIKLSGVFAQQIAGNDSVSSATQRLLTSLSDYHETSLKAAPEASLLSSLSIPHSRFALPDPQILLQRMNKPLCAVLHGEDTGTSVLRDDRTNRLFLLGHPEYEHDTLASEYSRDLAQDPTTPRPVHYQFPEENGGFITKLKKHPSPRSVTTTQSEQWQTLGAVLLRHWLAEQQPVRR